jgi:hypothetical protein
MGMIVPLGGEMHGLEHAPIEYSNSGTTHWLKVGDLIELEVEDFVPEGQSERTRIGPINHPASTLTVARATKSEVRVFGLEFSNEDKNGHAAPFSWSD